MGKTIDYYFTPASPYAYLGHDRFVALAARHGAAVDVCPVDIGKVFAVSGGVPLAQRPPQRLAYRLVELARWSRHLGIPINVPPKFGTTPVALASRWILAAAEIGPRAALDLAGAVMRARWAEERDIADPATLAAIAVGLGLDAAVAGGAGRDARDRHPVRSDDRTGDRRPGVRLALVRLRRGALLGTGSARLFGPRTGRIAR